MFQWQSHHVRFVENGVFILESCVCFSFIECDSVGLYILLDFINLHDYVVNNYYAIGFYLITQKSLIIKYWQDEEIFDMAITWLFNYRTSVKNNIKFELSPLKNIYVIS